MIRTVIQSANDSFLWVDIVEPSTQELKDIATKYSLPNQVVEDCLDPEHLPKYEKTESYTFLILRAFDELATKDSDTVHELTRKIALFIGKNFVLTIHRKDQPYIEALRTLYSQKNVNSVTIGAISNLVGEILEAVAWSYEKPLDEMQLKLEDLETRLFTNRGSSQIIQQGYFLRRKSAVIKRMLRFTIDVIPRIGASSLRESLDSLYFYADELLDNVNSLLNLNITMASHRTTEASHKTNEVMRVLTVFSVFFLPLNFIASIYGMNFSNMPELQTQYGYFFVLFAMFLVAISIFLWFKRKGWLEK